MGEVQGDGAVLEENEDGDLEDNIDIVYEMAWMNPYDFSS